jgi:hypothetical protein
MLFELKTDSGGTKTQSIAAWPVRYELHPDFPEWESDEDLSSSLCFLSAHTLVEGMIEVSTFWRRSGSAWEVGDAIAPLPCENESAACDALLSTIMRLEVLPLWRRHVSSCAPLQQRAIANKVSEARELLRAELGEILPKLRVVAEQGAGQEGRDGRRGVLNPDMADVRAAVRSALECVFEKVKHRVLLP